MITSKVVGLGIIGHHFTFSPGAVLLTAAGFAGIKLAAFALLSGKMVRREILYYFQDDEGENERASGRIRNGIFLMGGLLCLGAAYAAAISGTSWSSINAMCLTVAIGIVGMFLAFYGLGPFLERVWKGRQKGLGIFYSASAHRTGLSSLEASCDLIASVSRSVLLSGIWDLRCRYAVGPVNGSQCGFYLLWG